MIRRPQVLRGDIEHVGESLAVPHPERMTVEVD